MHRFQLKMHHKAFDGRAVPEPAGKLTALPRPKARFSDGPRPGEEEEGQGRNGDERKGGCGSWGSGYGIADC